VHNEACTGKGLAMARPTVLLIMTVFDYLKTDLLPRLLMATVWLKTGAGNTTDSGLTWLSRQGRLKVRHK
jgi:hypothetical protein